jgi:5-methylcytosine-specific restriction endonuclease McrA
MNNVIAISPVSVWDQKVSAARRWRRGEFNEELGKYFWQYRSDAAKSERWVTKEQLDHYRAYEQSKNAEWYSDHKKQHREVGKLWVNRNRSKTRSSQKKWRQKTPEKARMYAANYRQRKLSNLRDPSFIEGFYEIADRVTRCLKVRMEVDHIIPISLGGPHAASNLQVLPKFWNMKKFNNPNYRLPSCYITPAFSYE